LKKGKSVGADAQVTKPEMQRVVELADQLCFGHGTKPIPTLAPPVTSSAASLV